MLLNTALDRFVPSTVIAPSNEGDRQYLTVLGNAKGIQFQPQALLAPGANCLEEVTCEIAPNDDITTGTGNDRQTEMRKIRVVYPGFDDHHSISTLLPLGGVVLKMRDDIGIAQDIRRKDGRTFRAGYGVSQMEVGIPASTFMVIWNQVNRQLKGETNEDWQDQAAALQENPEHSALSVNGLRCQDGHYWMMASLHEGLKGVAMSTANEAVSADVIAVMREARRSFICDAATALRLIKFNQGEWELRMTVWTVALKDEASQHDIEHNLSRLALLGPAGCSKDSSPETISDWEEIDRD